MGEQNARNKPVINFKGEDVFRFLGLPTQLRATGQSTNGAFALVEHWEMPPGFASPYHMHHREDESFYVLHGEIAFVIDGRWQRGGPGTFVFGPREVPHGFKAVGDKPAHVLILATPAGFEQFLSALAQPLGDPIAPPDIPKMVETAARFGIDILGPLPDEPS
ncbi:MAG TPA: cupin domain-containing protein [Terracidiphilus sp.]|nr:cupin domain-containing protein [Terracidiphilus sp.]